MSDMEMPVLNRLLTKEPEECEPSFPSLSKKFSETTHK